MDNDNKSILIKNIYYMLAYAFHIINYNVYEKIESEQFEHIHDLFASILIKGVSRQVKQGLYRDYTLKNEEINTIKGKINFNGTLKNKMTKKRLISCQYDELTENNILNQIIKSTIYELSKQSTVTKNHKNNLKRLLFYFDQVDLIDLKSIRWDNLYYRKNNHNYKILINVCRFIVEGLLLTDKKGSFIMQTFINDKKMHYLFQNFVFEYYKYHFKQLRINASEIKWDIDEKSNNYLLPKMKTDIMLSLNAKKLIIDTKYYAKTLQYNFDSAAQISHNMYQIYTYVKNEDKDNLGNVSGLLLYAKTDEEINANNDYIISGNSISVRTLDLNKDFKFIKKQLDDIIEKYFDVCGF